MRRNTWQREAVREALGDTAGFVSAQSLHQAMREQGSEVGLATVYRALADLATEGEADSLQQEGESLYRACTPGRHHHHLICRRCGRTVEIEADPVEQWARRSRPRTASPSRSTWSTCSDTAPTARQRSPTEPLVV